jgi:serine phosphatase RsbU (regulator of sigma subunit)
MNGSPDLETLQSELRDLRAQLDAKTRIATRALATYQQRALQMEEHAAELRAANEEIRRVNARLSETLRVLEQRDRHITNDLEQARRFQQRILPDPPAADRLAFAILYRPAELVGGDVYDIWERAPGTFRVFLADATGHGVQAALRTMILKAEYDRIKIDARGPEHALMALNTKISAVYPGLELQCTASCFDISVDGDGRGSVRYATAAHPPLLVIGDSAPKTVYQPSPFLGVVPDIALEPVEVELRRGDRVLIYSDGLEEQWNGNGQEFGIERVEAAIGDRDHRIDQAVQRLGADWDAFLAGSRPEDDATLIAVERLR